MKKKASAKTSPVKKASPKKAKEATAKKTTALPAKKKLTTKKEAVKKKASKKVGAKKKREDLMCFLTTACVQQFGLPDNCYELKTLRRYRDTYLQRSEEGAALVAQYYRIAPSIVSKIEASEQKEKHYRFIYDRIQQSCQAIEANQLESAKKVYQSMVERLQRKLKVH